MKIKCYDKKFSYIIPKINCQLCKKYISTGENVYRVSLQWGNDKTTCKECYDMYEIDFSMRSNERQKRQEKQKTFKPIEFINEEEMITEG